MKDGKMKDELKKLEEECEHYKHITFKDVLQEDRELRQVNKELRAELKKCNDIFDKIMGTPESNMKHFLYRVRIKKMEKLLEEIKLYSFDELNTDRLRILNINKAIKEFEEST